MEELLVVDTVMGMGGSFLRDALTNATVKELPLECSNCKAVTMHSVRHHSKFTEGGNIYNLYSTVCGSCSREDTVYTTSKNVPYLFQYAYTKLKGGFEMNQIAEVVKEECLAGKREFFIIWNPDSQRPPRCVFNDANSAMDVADEMATKYDEKFFVMKAVSLHKIEKPVRRVMLADLAVPVEAPAAMSKPRRSARGDKASRKNLS